MENTNLIWHEPTISWKTQDEINQYELELLRQQEEIEKQRRQEELENQLPRVFVMIGSDGVVLNTILATREFISTNPYEGVLCIENTDKIKNEPSIGKIYNQTLNAFIDPQPYPSWVLNEETAQWEPPVPKPTN